MLAACSPKSSVRPALLLAGLAALSAGFGCALGEADVVNRSPDLGPVISAPPARDAAAGETATDSGHKPSSSDAGDACADARDATALPTDASIAVDASEPDGFARGDAMAPKGDGAPRGEAGEGHCEPGLVFCDDFEDGASAWLSTGEAWKAVDDPTSEAGNQVLAPAEPSASCAYFPLGAWQDMTVEVRVRVLAFGLPSSSSRAEVYARYQDAGHLYAVSLHGDGKLGLRRNGSGFGTAASVAVAENEWHTLEIKVSGPEDAVAVEGHLDGVLLTTATDTSGALAGPVGTVGLGVYGGASAVFDDLKVSSP